MELPRLSRASQRRFKTLATNSLIDNKTTNVESLQWQKVKKFVSEKSSKVNEKNLQNLQTITKSLTNGEETEELINDLTLFLLKLFLNEKHVMNKHIGEMKNYFGEISNAKATEIYKIVKLIEREFENENDVDLLLKIMTDLSALDDFEGNERKIFGTSIKFHSREYFKDTSILNNISDSSGFVMQKIEDFSMNYNSENKKVKTESRIIYDKFWISRRVNDEHLVDCLVTILKSQRSNDEIQNELFELLGFDKFELIQEILENRGNINKSLSFAEKKEELVSHQTNHKNQVSSKPAPDFLMPVLVQSEKEKELQKLARKDEKKLKNIKPADIEEEDELALALRLSDTQSQIQKVQNTPILSTTHIIRTQPRYPFVFDESKDAKAHIGFIANTKIMLPSGTDRKNNQMYEEVGILLWKVYVKNLTLN